jgi:acyl-coenzyme A synthetase/AMP-(fatty) acid ligase
MNAPPNNFLNRILAARAPEDLLLVSGNDMIRAGLLFQKSCFTEIAHLAGANVLIMVSEALACALSLIELDGVASRVIICPPQLSQAELEVLASRGEVDTIICDLNGSLESGLANGRQILSFNLLVYDRPTTQNLNELTTEWVLLTSGTTGVPKMVSHTFESLTSNIKRPKTELDTIIWASFNDTRRFSGLQMFLQATLTDSTLILRKQSESVAEFLPILTKESATHVSGTPTHWRKVLMFAQRAALKFEQITLVGEIADQPLLDALHAVYPAARLTHIYGSTETGTGFSVHDNLAGFPKSLIGRNLSGAEFAVDGEKLKVRSTRAAKSYVGTDHNLKDADGFIDTGDAVELVGERYRFLGRRSGTINVGGSHVHPEEVEAVLNSDQRVSLSRVSGRKSPFTGAILVAEVVVDRDIRSKDLSAELLNLCKLNLENHKVPAVINFVDDIAVSAAGKLGRHNA